MWIAYIWSGQYLILSSVRKCLRSFTYFSQRENIQGIGIDMLISNYLMYKHWFSPSWMIFCCSVVKLNRLCTIIVSTDTHMVRACQGIYKARQIPYITLYKTLKLQSSSPVQYSIPVVHSTVCTLPFGWHTTGFLILLLSTMWVCVSVYWPPRAFTWMDPVWLVEQVLIIFSKLT